MKRLINKDSGTYSIKDIVGDLSQVDVENTLAMIVAQVVDDLDSASISVTRAARTTVIELIVARRDRGKLIGRDGHVVAALKTVMRAIQGEASANTSYKITLLDEPVSDNYNS